jgi:hypothetical protein
VLALWQQDSDSQVAAKNRKKEGGQPKELKKGFDQGSPDSTAIIVSFLPGRSHVRPGRVMRVIADQADESEKGKEYQQKTEYLYGPEAFSARIFFLRRCSFLLFLSFHTDEL